MRKIIAIAIIAIMIACNQSPVTPGPDQCTVTVSAKIVWQNPYSDLSVMMDMDSVVRVYTRDTLDKITVQRGEKIALIYYRSSSPDSLVWVPMRVVSDTTIWFYGRKITL